MIENKIRFNKFEILTTCVTKMPIKCNKGFYCRSYCLLNMFRAPLCPSPGAQEYYTVAAACGISCCGFQVAGVELRVMCPVCRMLAGFYCRTYCFLNMFRAPLCPSSGAQEYYTVITACSISCCGFQVAGLVWS